MYIFSFSNAINKLNFALNVPQLSLSMLHYFSHGGARRYCIDALHSVTP
jgi:hypothetical protein